MTTIRPRFRYFPAALLAILSLAAASFAQNNAFPQVKIKNFGQMDERFYRGAQPKKEDYQSLATLGIKTVIDLRDDATDSERTAVETLGMHYVNIPMSDKSYPRDEQIAQFLKLAGDPATGKFYVHCAGGRHRTGVMGAVYRYNFYHWNYDQVYSEMKQYDFYTRFGHGDMKKYVEDYWQHIQSGQLKLATSTTTAAGTH
jgi:protein tyrosine/serine phosphatase